MKDPIKLIYQFNQQAGLLDKGYDDFLESSFQIEEALEPFVNADSTLTLELHDSFTPKELARAIMDEVFSCTSHYTPKEATDVDRLDIACDAIVFAFGSIFKLGLTPEQAVRAINVVMEANLTKLSMPKDEYGKLTKSADFVGPEPLLDVILKERTCDN